MALTKLQFRPGINRENTSYSNEGGWFDCDKVRFKQGYPEKIGGYSVLSGATFQGTCRSLHTWKALSGEKFTGVGTHLKFFVEEGGAYNDITPVRATTTAGDVTFSATDGSTTITVSDTAHGAVAGDFVTFSGAVTLGGEVTADVLNEEFQITALVDDNSYEIEVATAANASDTGNGGSSVVGTYQINVGLDVAVGGTGWGAGSWSRGAWGSSSNLLAVTDIMRLWNQDNFGEDLILNVRDGGIYYWDKSTKLSAGVYSRAEQLSDLSGADDTTPTIAKKVIVSDTDRHVIAFGCDAENTIGTQDPLLIRFSDQENPLVWKTEVNNTAGDLRIGSGSEIVTAIETRQQTLVFTDVSLHSMQYLGPPFTFGVNLISENITIASPNAAKAVDDVVIWMGDEEFYIYDGRVRKIPCTVKSYVFDNFNALQKEKAFAALNSSFDEIWWFYPSSGSLENDRYVVYNYSEQSWYIGTLDRTAWLDRGVNQFPVAASPSENVLYNQEIGTDAVTTTTTEPLNAYIEASQMDIGDGDNFVFIRRMIPDISFLGSTAESPTLDMTIKARNFPGSSYHSTNAKTISSTQLIPVEEFTDQVHIRIRGRSFALRVESNQLGVDWRLGSPRVDLRPDGRR